MRLVLAAILLAVSAPAAEPLEIEVRVPGNAGLSQSDFTLREGGGERPILDVRYVPPVHQWHFEPDAAEPTRIYVLTEAPMQSLLSGIGCFLGQDLPPKTSISLAGLPFTDDALALRDRIPELREASTQYKDEWIGPLPPDADPTMLRAYPQARQFGVYRYRDLVRRLARYPGRKIVVVLRFEGLDFVDWSRNYQELWSEAVRSRVFFHTAAGSSGPEGPLIAQGLLDLAVSTGGQAYALGSGSSTLDKGRYGSIHWLSQTPILGPQLGMYCHEGGYFYNILMSSLQSAGDYYVVRYQPADGGEPGAYRPLEVEVRGTPPLVKAPAGYFEPRRRTPNDVNGGLKSLYEALQATDLDDAPLRLTEVFAPSPAHPEDICLISNVFVPPDVLDRSVQSDAPVVDFMVFGRATALEGERMPVYSGTRYVRRFDSSHWETLASDPRAFLQDVVSTPLAPGLYQWALVWRDQASGREGRYTRQVEVPASVDLQGASELILGVELPEQLIGGRQEQTELSSPSERRNRPYQRIAAARGNSRYASPPDGVFVAGETLHVEYVVRSASARKRNFRFLEARLTQADKTLAKAELEVEKLKGWEVTRVSARFPLDAFPPGDYAVQVETPGGEPLAKPFTLVDR